MGASESLYGWWNAALFDHFFNARQRNRQVYFHIDEDTLKVIGAAIGVPEQESQSSFLRSFSWRFDKKPAAPFGQFMTPLRRWNRSSPPPFMSLLALCVFAASSMHRDGMFTAANYYGRLDALIGQIPFSHSVANITTNNFKVLDSLWEMLRRWLNEDLQGDLGFCTARPIGHKTHVGYPISQSLLSTADRLRLRDFFIFSGVRPREIVAHQDLLAPLMSWCSRSSCSFTKRDLVRVNGEVRLLVAELAASEAQVWDGDTEDIDTGQRTAPIIVRVEPSRGAREFDLEFYPRAPVDFPAHANFQTAQQPLQAFDLRAMGSPAYYEPIRVNAMHAFEQGINLRHGKFALRFKPSRIILATRDYSELGAYVSRTHAPFGEPMVLLCQEALVQRLEAFLRENAEGWQPAAGKQGLPEGWRAYINVRIVRLARFPHDEFQCLVPDLYAATYLEGGLKLDSSTWLSGAEPTLHISLADGGRFDVRVNQRRVFSGQGSDIFDLSKLNLDPGQHTIEVATRIRNFATARAETYHRRTRMLDAPLPIAHVLTRDDVRYEATYPSPTRVLSESIPPHQVRITGVFIEANYEDLPENLAQPLEVECGSKRYIIIGPQPGMVYVFHDPSVSQLVYRNGSQTTFRIVPPFRPVWLIRNMRSVSLIGEGEPPSAIPWDSGDPEEWKRLCRKKYSRPPKGDAFALWCKYVDEAVS